ncbi:MAG: hypothetical protein AB7E96_12245 [Deferribacterales bacterium]
MSDIDTFKDYINSNNIFFETLVIIGNSEYRGKENDIDRLIREGKVKNIIVIGHEENQSLLLNKWRWTYQEYSYLSDQRESKIEILNVEPDPYELEIKNLISFFKSIETEYHINLNILTYIKWQLYSFCLPKNNNSRGINEFNAKVLNYYKHAEEVISENLDNQNIDPEKILIKIREIFNVIIDSFKNNKLPALQENIQNNKLVILDDFIWKEEFIYKNIRYVHPKDLKPDKIFENTIYYFLGTMNFNRFYKITNIVKLISDSSGTFMFVCYPEEAEFLISLLNKIENYNLTEYCSELRYEITNIKFSPSIIPKKWDQVDDYTDVQDTEMNYKPRTFFRISFTDGDNTVCERGQYILLDNNGSWSKLKAAHLKAGDVVRIYNGNNKDVQYKSLLKSDENDLLKIENDSLLWKTSLSTYFEVISKSSQNPLNELLCILQESGIKIKTQLTLKKWLDTDSKDKFPRSNRDLNKIANITGDKNLIENLNAVKNSRKSYRAIMIALGKNLSEEISDYVIGEKIADNIVDRRIETVRVDF